MHYWLGFAGGGVPDPPPVGPRLKPFVPGLELPNVELPTGFDVLLAGWPMAPVLPPLMVCMSERGSYVNSHSL
jgi:hypothetical protein